jgi:hypothetical protein
MNQTSPNPNLRTPPAADALGHGDQLDRLLSDYFKSKLRNPWPAAPATGPLSRVSEPSELVASRTAEAEPVIETPRNNPTAARPLDRSRLTLACSVAMLVGACWVLSNGYQSTSSPRAPSNASNKSLNVFDGATAENPEALKEVRKNQAETPAPKGPVQNFQMP